MIEMMVGRALTDFFPKVNVDRGDLVIEVRHLAGGRKVRDVSFQLYAGEILGLAGLIGAGRTETARLIFGIDKKERGEIFLRGKRVDIHTPMDALKSGIGLLPEDRKLEGLIPGMNVRENMTISVLERLTSLIIRHVDYRKEQALTQHYVRRLSIQTPSFEQLIVNLSGGNQQKVVLAKLLAANPQVLILDEPTRGIDVGAKTEIYRLMSELARQEIAILMISSEMPEILGMSDRIVVMCEGAVTGELSRGEATQANIMKLATVITSSHAEVEI
jgi:ribose transport system ATP-binding protein